MENNHGLTLFAIFIFFAYLLPFHFLPFSSFYNEWLAVLAVVIVFAYALAKKVITMHVPWICIVPLGLAVLVAIQVLMGMLTASWDAALPVAYFIVATIAIILGASITMTERGAFKLCLAFACAHLFAGLVSVAIQTLQFFAVEAIFDPIVMLMPHEVGKIIRPIANIAQPNQLALLLCIAIASVWWLYQSSRVKVRLVIPAILFLLWGLVMTQSRIGWLIIPAFGLLAWVTRNKVGFKKIPVAIILGLVLSYIILIVALPTIALLAGTLATSVGDRVGGRSDRLVLFQQALQISMSYPWFGAGWYEFGPQQLRIAPHFDPSGYSQHAHNLILNFAAELGWPATILIFAILSYWLFVSYFRRPISKEAGFAMLIFVSISVHSMVEFPLWYAYVLMPLAFLIGLVHQEQFGSKQVTLSRNYAVSILFLMFIGLVGTAMDYRRLVSATWKNESALPFSESGWGVENSKVTIFPHFYDYFEAKKIPIRVGMSKDEIALIEAVTARFGFVEILERFALALTLNDRQLDAVKTLITLSKVQPSYYSYVYKAWGKLADREPEKFAYVFNHMPKIPE